VGSAVDTGLSNVSTMPVMSGSGPGFTFWLHGCSERAGNVSGSTSFTCSRQNRREGVAALQNSCRAGLRAALLGWRVSGWAPVLASEPQTAQGRLATR